MLTIILCINFFLSVQANRDLSGWDSFLQGRLRESSFPFISGDSFRSIAHHIFDETNKIINPENIKYKDIIFVRTYDLEEFFRRIHPYIQNKYILITHNADDLSPGKFEHFLNDDKILVWFGQNPSIKNHKKFIPIPIGIANRYWNHGNIETFIKVIKKGGIACPKKYLLGINFKIETKANVRQPIFNYFSTQSFCKNLYNENHELYLSSMADAKFVISPPGNGPDCHRIWEALLVGTIPIVLRSSLDELLEDLPVLIVDDWKQITESFLNESHEKLKIFHDFNCAKLYMPYWYQLIEFYRDQNIN